MNGSLLHLLNEHKQMLIGNGGYSFALNNIDDKQDYTLYLLKGDDNILFIVDPTSHLLVGNEDFSYTLNRRKEEYAPTYR